MVAENRGSVVQRQSLAENRWLCMRLHVRAGNGSSSAPMDLMIRRHQHPGAGAVTATRSSSEIALHRPGLTSDRVLDFGSSTGSIAGLSDDGALLAVNYSGTGSGTDYET